MTRQLTITAAEWASRGEEGRLWLVREGVRWGTAHLEANAPPVEFVQACAPCKRCLGHRWVPGDRNGLDYGYHPNERNAAEAAGKEPWVCELCGTGDGSWPCESVLLIDGAGL